MPAFDVAGLKACATQAFRRVRAVAVVAALLLGVAAASFYATHDLTLSHYDAKAHLVVARRIFDSLTPGWRQIGAVWLPLPHVLNAIPVQVDAWYRSGFSGVAISVACFAIATGALADIVLQLTRSQLAAAAAVGVWFLQPDLLFLQSTPMTEPLLLALMLGGIASLVRFVGVGASMSPHVAGAWLALACLTRYEAWPVTAAAIAFTAFALWRDGWPVSRALEAAARISVLPAVALVGFLCLSKATIGAWLVTGGFYVPDNPASGRPFKALIPVGWGLRQLAGLTATLAAAAGAVVMFARALVNRSQARQLVPLALGAAAVLPWYAFVSGHPFRIRYMVVLMAGVAVATGVLVGTVKGRIRVLAVVLLIAGVAVERRPFSLSSPMVAEAQWDRPYQRGRDQVTACLRQHFDGELILASMGSLAHYMQELSRAGFPLRAFIHEGIGEIWFEALASPRRHAGWVLIEERAEGGDELAKLRHHRPAFLDGFVRVCEGGGVALYQRQ